MFSDFDFNSPLPPIPELWRQCLTSEYTLVLSASAQLLVPYDPCRLSVVIGTTGNQGVSIGWSPGLTLSNGLPLHFANGSNSVSTPVVLSLSQHGGLVFGPIYAIGGAAITGQAYAVGSSLHICAADRERYLTMMREKGGV